MSVLQCWLNHAPKLPEETPRDYAKRLVQEGYGGEGVLELVAECYGVETVQVETLALGTLVVSEEQEWFTIREKRVASFFDRLSAIAV